MDHTQVHKHIIHPHTIKRLDQTGKRISALRDSERKAQPPGKRISRTGNIYWETRKNRSDVYGRRL